MATNQTMTSFMGSELGGVDERVTKALNASTPKLSIQQFIAATGLKMKLIRFISIYIDIRRNVTNL